MAEKNGVPENTNPFCMVEDNDICDGMFNEIAPQYFEEISDNTGGCCFVCKPQTNSKALSQEEVEKLVRDLFTWDVLKCLAVREEFIHIIPPDLADGIWVARSPYAESGMHQLQRCYRLNPDCK